MVSGYKIFAAVTYACSAGAIVLWTNLVAGSGLASRPLTLADKVLLLVLALASGPVFASVAAGQIDTIVLCFCVGHVALLRAGRPVAAGSVLAFGCWIKIYPVLLIALALRSPDRIKVVAGVAAAGAIIPVLASPFVPAHLYMAYFMSILPDLSSRTILNIYNQSNSAFILRFGFPIQDSLQNYTAVPVPVLLKLGSLMAALCAVVLLARKAGRSSWLDTVVGASLMMLIGPIAPLGWGHTYVYTLPMFVVLLAVADGRRLLTGFILVSYVAMAIPAYHHFPALDGLPGPVQNLVYSRYLLVTLVMLAVVWGMIVFRPRRQSLGTMA